METISPCRPSPLSLQFDLHRVGLADYRGVLLSRPTEPKGLARARLTKTVFPNPSMTFLDILPTLKVQMPRLRGRLIANQPLAELTWFRVGGPAQVLFMPEDEQDLSYFLAHLPPEIPVTVIGLGSNLIVRDGGVPGVVIRLGRGFSNIAVEDNAHVRAGAAVPDVKVARGAQEAAIAGLSFLRGIPGAIGGAL